MIGRSTQPKKMAASRLGWPARSSPSSWPAATTCSMISIGYLVPGGRRGMELVVRSTANVNAAGSAR